MPAAQQRRFAYLKLSTDQQRHVHRHLSFGLKAALRYIAKHFSSAAHPAPQFLLDGYYGEIDVRVDSLTFLPVTVDGFPWSDVQISVANSSRWWDNSPELDHVSITFHIRLQPNRFCSGIELSDRNDYTTRDPLTLLPTRETSAGVTAYPYSKNFRIVDKLTRWMKMRQVSVSIDRSLCHPIQMLPDGFGELNIFWRHNFAISAEFEGEISGDSREISSAYWMPKDTCPDQATISGVFLGWPLAAFLENFKDAVDQLINTPFLRLTQSYWKVKDCLESVSIIPQLVHHILQSPLPSTPERRRLVIIDVELQWPEFAQRPASRQVAMKRFADAEEEMMAKLGEMMNRMDIPFTTQLYQLMYPLGDESNEICQPTGIHAIIAQNYTSKKQLIHEGHYYQRHRRIGANDLKLRWSATPGQ